MTLEDLSSLGELDSCYLGNQCLVSNTESHNTSHEILLHEDFFQEGVVPPYNPPLADPLGPVLVQVAVVPFRCSPVPTSNIPEGPNGSWSFGDNLSPPLLPPLMVSTT